MICPYLKSSLSLTLFWHFWLSHLEEVILKMKVSCSSKHNWERFFFREMFLKKIPKVCLYFCSTERNSESLLLFLFHDTEFRAIFSSRICLQERNSESFLFRRTAGILSEQTVRSVYSVFRGIIFLVGNPEPSTMPVYGIQCWGLIERGEEQWNPSCRRLSING